MILLIVSRLLSPGLQTGYPYYRCRHCNCPCSP